MGLIVPQSPPGGILRAVRERRITPLASWELAEEIAEVVRRPELRRYRIQEVDIVDLLATLAPFLPTIAVAVALHDQDDLPLIATAVAGKAAAIITCDRDLLEDQQLSVRLAKHGVSVRTPTQALETLVADGRR